MTRQILPRFIAIFLIFTLILQSEGAASSGVHLAGVPSPSLFLQSEALSPSAIVSRAGSLVGQFRAAAFRRETSLRLESMDPILEEIIFDVLMGMHIKDPDFGKFFYVSDRKILVIQVLLKMLVQPESYLNWYRKSGSREDKLRDIFLRGMDVVILLGTEPYQLSILPFMPQLNKAAQLAAVELQVGCPEWLQVPIANQLRQLQQMNFPVPAKSKGIRLWKWQIPAEWRLLAAALFLVVAWLPWHLMLNRIEEWPAHSPAEHRVVLKDQVARIPIGARESQELLGSEDMIFTFDSQDWEQLSAATISIFDEGGRLVLESNHYGIGQHVTHNPPGRDLPPVEENAISHRVVGDSIEVHIPPPILNKYRQGGVKGIVKESKAISEIRITLYHVGEKLGRFRNAVVRFRFSEKKKAESSRPLGRSFAALIVFFPFFLGFSDALLPHASAATSAATIVSALPIPQITLFLIAIWLWKQWRYTDDGEETRFEPILIPIVMILGLLAVTWDQEPVVAIRNAIIRLFTQPKSKPIRPSLRIDRVAA